MNKRDFFRRLGLAVAALFVPNAVMGRWLGPAPTNHRLYDVREFGAVGLEGFHMTDCTFQNPVGTITVTLPVGYYRVSEQWIVPHHLVIRGSRADVSVD